MKVSRQEAAQVRTQISHILLRKYYRRHKLLKITLESRSAQFDQHFLILVEHQPVLVPKDAKHMQSRAHLGGNREICRRSAWFTNRHAQFINKLCLAPLFQKLTGEP